MENCVIVGASHAGVSLALQLRKDGWAGGIQLVSAEAALPYHRPPLSKDLLAGTKSPDDIRLRPEKTYADNAIELLLNNPVTAIDRQHTLVQLASGDNLHYTKLALCVGARARRLPYADEFNKICYIRTLEDTARLSARVEAGKRVVVIGGGYIGLEAAAQLVQRGLRVTVLEAADRILNRVTAPILSDYYTALHAVHGVDIECGVTITGITGSESSVRVLYNEGRELTADFIIAGIGITPETALAASAGLQVDQGIVVNEFTQTSDPHIYAAGDCTRHPSPLYARQLRLESVQNATDQARIAAANICGKNLPYDTVPWFWSDQYAIKLQTAGVNTGYGTLVLRGDVTSQSGNGCVVFYLQDGRLLAADCINRPKEFMASKLLIRSGKQVDQNLLTDESMELVKLG